MKKQTQVDLVCIAHANCQQIINDLHRANVILEFSANLIGNNPPIAHCFAQMEDQVNRCIGALQDTELQLRSAGLLEHPDRERYTTGTEA